MATTEVPRDGTNHSGAAKPTSSGHLIGISPEKNLRNLSAPTNDLGKGLLHADIQRQQLRGDLPEELPFGFDRGHLIDHLPLLVFVGEGLKPFW